MVGPVRVVDALRDRGGRCPARLCTDGVCVLPGKYGLSGICVLCPRTPDGVGQTTSPSLKNRGKYYVESDPYQVEIKKLPVRLRLCTTRWINIM